MSEKLDDETIKSVLGVDVKRGPLELKHPLRFKGREEEVDDGLTAAQRASEAAKERRAIQEAMRSTSLDDRIRQFNEKLAKQTDHQEMPRVSG